jgi:hypothetical protein
MVNRNQSRRDLAKVAQYEVLGNEAKNRSVPSGTDILLKCQPSTSYWATFVKSLRD